MRIAAIRRRTGQNTEPMQSLRAQEAVSAAHSPLSLHAEADAWCAPTEIPSPQRSAELVRQAGGEGLRHRMRRRRS